MLDLKQRSIDIILAGQFDGAYAACHSFSQYGYSWLRDGTWIAYGMDAVGQTASARAFHQWATRTLMRYQTQVQHILAKLAQAIPLDETDYLPTRFELDGNLGREEWPNFQLDGYGAWLWGLVQFVEKHGDHDLWLEALPAVSLTVRYLTALWQSPNYDCWEEHRPHIHPATLAALYGGLNAVARHAPQLVPADVPPAIRDFVLKHALAPQGHFMKYIGNEAVDASLLWLAVPYGLVDLHDPHFQHTLHKIEQDIHRQGGGVYRYLADTYYGGGEWLLLTLWLAWVYIEMGQLEQAKSLVAWVEAQAEANGEMPEQVDGHVLAPEYLEPWRTRWGTSASPLLWSHGMYLWVTARLQG